MHAGRCPAATSATATAVTAVTAVAITATAGEAAQQAADHANLEADDARHDATEKAAGNSLGFFFVENAHFTHHLLFSSSISDPLSAMSCAEIEHIK
jgi:hypothetical protein